MLCFLKRQLKKMLKLTLRTFKKIKLIPLLLTVIAITLLIQTFVPDNQRRLWFNRINGQLQYLKPKIVTDMTRRSFTCQKEVETPEYKQYKKQVSDCQLKNALRNKNGSILDSYMQRKDTCKAESGPAPQKTMQVEDVCEKMLPESKWFMIFGKKIFKIKTYYY